MSPTLAYLTGWNHGFSPPNTNGGGLCTVLTGDVTVVSNSDLDTSYALQCKPTGAAQGRLSQTITGNNTLSRFYFYLSVAPASGNAIIAFYGNNTDLQTPRLDISVTSGKFEIQVDDSGVLTLVATGPSYTTGRWYLCELYVEWNVNPWVLKAKVTDETTGIITEFGGTYIHAATANTRVSLGSYSTTGPAYTGFFKHWVVSVTTSDYPIGEGRVIGLSPNADGTHNAGTNTIEAQDGTDIGTTTAYDKINSVPMGSTTTYLRQATANTGAYAEVAFPDLTDAQRNVQGVGGLIAYTAATTSADQAAVGVMDAGTFISIFGNPTTRADFSDGSTSNLYWKFAYLALASKDNASVNALTARFGYSNDVSPNPYLIDLMLEVAYSLTKAPPPFQSHTNPIWRKIR